MANTIPGVLTLVEPTGDEAPVVFDSPHSGNEFPADFASIVPEHRLRAAEDRRSARRFSARASRAPTSTPTEASPTSTRR